MTAAAGDDPFPLLPGQVIPHDELELIQRCARASSGGIEQHTAHLFALAVARAAPLIVQMAAASPQPIDRAQWRVLLIRGAFWKEHPWTGARGERVLRTAAQLGLDVETVNTPSLGTLDANANRILDHLQRPDPRRVILVSLSKGSADVKAALNHPGAQSAFAHTTAWIDLSGTTEGTPVIDQLRRVWWRWLAIRLTLALRRQPLEAIRELAATSGPLTLPPSLSPGMFHIRLLGFPLRRHLLNPWSRRAFARLEAQGPNDGGGVLLRRAIDLCPPPNSIVLPIWGADHYLRPPWDFDPSLAALLRICAQRPASQ